MSITPYINETRMRLHECCDNQAMNITAPSRFINVRELAMNVEYDKLKELWLQLVL